MKDLTADLRKRKPYRAGSHNESNEMNEIPTVRADGNSCNSFTSSASGERPKLCEGALYGPLGEIVRRHQGFTEADPAAILAQLLVGVGSIIGPRPYFLADGARHHANLFTIICGRTAKARKGTAWARAKNVLSALDDWWLSNCVKSGVVSGEGITQVFSNDDEKRLLLVESEFGQILQSMKRDGNTVSVLLRQAWDGTRLAVLRKKDPIEVEGAHISLIGHITLPELLKLLASVEISNGTANRCLWVFADRALLLPEGGGQPDLSGALESLRPALASATTRDRMDRDDSARELWAGIYADLSNEAPGVLGELLSRAEAQVMRMALLYALIDNAPAIQAAHLQAALAFWRYCEASTTFIFAESVLSTKARRIWDALGAGPLTMTQIHAAFHNNAKKDEIETALSELANRIEYRSNDGASGRIIMRK